MFVLNFITINRTHSTKRVVLFIFFFFYTSTCLSLTVLWCSKGWINNPTEWKYIDLSLSGSCTQSTLLHRDEQLQLYWANTKTVSITSFISSYWNETDPVSILLILALFIHMQLGYHEIKSEMTKLCKACSSKQGRITSWTLLRVTHRKAIQIYSDT